MIARKRFVTYVIGFTILGFLLSGHMPLGQLIWPPAEMEGMADPTGVQIGLLMVYTLVAAVGFGFGIAWLRLGWPVMRRAVSSPGLALGAHLAIVWVTASWIPHDALHMTFGMNLWALIGLEWGFHATLILAGCVLARFFYVTTTRNVQGTPATATREGAPTRARAT